MAMNRMMVIDVFSLRKKRIESGKKRSITLFLRSLIDMETPYEPTMKSFW
jgi:hypothetical protein